MTTQAGRERVDGSTILRDMASQDIVLDGSALSIPAVTAVARLGATVRLDQVARARVDAARAAVLAQVALGKPIYGINTGFGNFAQVRVDDHKLADLQRNIVRSHAAGVGEPLPAEVVRGAMLLTAASLARGISGVRPAVIDAIIAHLNAGIVPVVPEVGSVGASGDLAPLSHIALALIGEGDVTVSGRTMPAAEAQRMAGIAPLALEMKEGLSLLNGTHVMAATAALALDDTRRLAGAAVAATAMAIDGCRASDSGLDARIHHARCQPGQELVAQRLRALLKGSQVLPSHKEGDPRVQDPYGLRCAPQVLGAALDAVAWAEGVVARELGAVTDNPLVFTLGGTAIVSGGNFHGMPLAIALDTLKIALCHVAGISERRTYWALSGHDRESRVRPHLAVDAGFDSGLMIAQYTAAACVNELGVLSHPASPGNVPTSAGIEDYNSMGATSARHARRAVELATHVVAIELQTMAEALDCQRPLRSGDGVERAHAIVRGAVPRLTGDRSPAPDIAAIAGLIRSGAFDRLLD